jgi:hypothetical protein
MFEPYCHICQDIFGVILDGPSGIAGICSTSNRIIYHIFKRLYGILKNVPQKKLPFGLIFDILLFKGRRGKGEK